jgi:hypothetical protein
MKLNSPTLKSLILKEFKKVHLESIDHEGIRLVVDASARCMSAIEEFEKKMTPEMANSASSCLEELKTCLTGMIENPGSYVQKNKKVISLKRQG